MKNSPYLDLPLRTEAKARLDIEAQKMLDLKNRVSARVLRRISAQCGDPVIVDEAHYPLKEQRA